MAAGPFDDHTIWLAAAQARVRTEHHGRWYAATAQLDQLDPQLLRRFTRYARSSMPAVDIDPALLPIDVAKAARPRGGAVGVIS